MCSRPGTESIPIQAPASRPGLVASSDLGPEGLAFVRAADIPDSIPGLIVGHEVSGTTTIHHVDVTPLWQHGGRPPRAGVPGAPGAAALAAQCLCSVFEAPSARTGAFTSTVSRLPSLPSITNWMGTVSPACSVCFRSISIT